MNLKFGDVVYGGLGKALLRICGFTADGRYLAQKILTGVREDRLLQYFQAEMLRPGNILLLPSGRKIMLIGRRPNGFWDNTYPDDIVELSETNIEEFQAEGKAAFDYTSVATRRECGVSRNIRFMPKRTD